MNKLIVSFFLSVFLFAFAANASAQQWSDAQREVWAAVDAYWAVSMSNTPMDFLKVFDDSYVGWSTDNEAPNTKADVQKALGYWLGKGKVMYYIITPAKIWVNGDFAFVHYYYTQVTESPDGKPNTEKGRWTDILMKKGGKWMLVGDHGGEIKKED